MGVSVVLGVCTLLPVRRSNQFQLGTWLAREWPGSVLSFPNRTQMRRHRVWTPECKTQKAAGDLLLGPPLWFVMKVSIRVYLKQHLGSNG